MYQRVRVSRYYYSQIKNLLYVQKQLKVMNSTADLKIID